MEDAKKNVFGSKEMVELAQKKRKENIEARIAQGLSPNADPMEKFRAKPTLPNAVKAFCFDCMGQAQSWRSDVKECTAPKCPLYSFRPGRTKTKEVQEIKGE